MLFAAGHAKNDIPSVLNTYVAMHDNFEIIYGRELGIDLKMIRAAGDRMYDGVDEAMAKFPDIEFIKVPYLNDHDLVTKTFFERLGEILEGQNLINCALCKFREQVFGFENEVGLAQESHHHHVEGVGGGLENCPCKGDCDASCRDEEFCKINPSLMPYF